MTTSESIAAEVRAALARPRLGPTDVARVLGCSLSTASRKINGHTPFSAVELVAVATLASVDVADFYSADPAPVRAPSTSAYADGGEAA